jgi:hypothetical protein
MLVDFAFCVPIFPALNLITQKMVLFQKLKRWLCFALDCVQDWPVSFIKEQRKKCNVILWKHVFFMISPHDYLTSIYIE